MNPSAPASTGAFEPASSVPPQVPSQVLAGAATRDRRERVSVAARLQMFVGGCWVDSAGGRVMPSVDPCTEEVLTEVPDAGAEDVEAAVAAARAGFAEWSGLPWQERAAALTTLAERIARHADEFATLDALDAGISVRGMAKDVRNAVDALRYFAGITPEIKGSTIEAPGGGLNLTLREPFGVVARIVPFNHPIQFAAAGIAAPLAAGNAVILKPSDVTPLSALRLAELAADLLPAGTLNVVTGTGAVGAALVAHPAVPRVAFTGSVPTGRRVAVAAAEHLKTVTLELGGKNPLIVFPDADIDAVAEATVQAMNFTRGQGQSCGAPSRALVHRSVAADFVDAVRQRFEAQAIGDPLRPETELGPVTSEAQYRRILDYVEIGRNEGARLVTGGRRPAGIDRGYFVAPTLFDRVAPDMRIATEEIFGPVLGVLEWTEEGDALAVANALPYGLTANIWTNDLTRALRFGGAVEAGYVWVNGRGQRPFGAPFGGVKYSGIGTENGIEELLSYTQLKNLNITPGGRS